MANKKFKLDKNALFLAVTTLIAILSWVFFEVYRILDKSTVTKINLEQMKVLNPQIDTQTIQALKTKLILDEGELNTAPAPVSLELETESETTP